MDEYGNIIDDSQASEVFGDSVHEIEGFVEHIISVSYTHLTLPTN